MAISRTTNTLCARWRAPLDPRPPSLMLANYLTTKDAGQNNRLAHKKRA